MGAGKTTVCQQLKKELPNAIFLDGDWCWDMNPFQINEETRTMVLDNIAYVLNAFIQCAAFENVIFCWVMHEQEIIDNILSRLHLEDCTLQIISLVCSQEVLRARLEKDIESGIRTPDILERSVKYMSLYNNLNTTKIDTSSLTTSEVVQKIKSL